GVVPWGDATSSARITRIITSGIKACRWWRIFIWVRFVLKRMAAITKKETRLTISPRWELVAKLFSEGTQSGIEKQQTAQLLTGSREASFDIAAGEIQPGGDFAEFKPAIVTEQQYLPMPVIQSSDQGH